MKKKLLIIGVALISFSVFYSLFLKDIIEKAKEKRCFHRIEEIYNSALVNIDSRKARLEIEQRELENKHSSLLKELDKKSKELEKQLKSDSKYKEAIEKIDQEIASRPRVATFTDRYWWEKLNRKTLVANLERVKRQLLENYKKDNPEFKKNNDELRTIELRINEIKTTLEQLEKDKIRAKEIYDEQKDFCLERY